MERVRKLLEALSKPVRAACERNAPTGAHGRAQRALAQLHLGENRFTHTDNLMLPTLGKFLFNTPRNNNLYQSKLCSFNNYTSWLSLIAVFIYSLFLSKG